LPEGDDNRPLVPFELVRAPEREAVQMAVPDSLAQTALLPMFLVAACADE